MTARTDSGGKTTTSRRRREVPSLDRIPAGGSGKSASAVDAILGDRPDATRLDVAIALLDAHPDNPREDVGDVSEDAQTMREVGVLQPLVVLTSRAYRASLGETDFVDDGRYVILAGHRRRAAAIEAGLTAVPVVVRDDLAGARALETMLIENLHRVDLKPLEEARGYAKLRELKLTQTQISEKVGRSQAHVSKRLSLLDLPDDLRADVAAERMELTAAVELSRYAHDPAVLESVRASVRANGGKLGGEGTVERLAKGIADQREKRQAAADKVAELQAADPDLRIVEPPYSYGWSDYLSGRPAVASFAALRSEGITIADHATLPCHAVSVVNWQGQLQVVDVCTTVKAHIAERDKVRRTADQKRRDAAAKKEARERAKKQVAIDSRRAILAKQLAGKAALPAATGTLLDEIAVSLLLEFFDGDASFSLTARLLGIDIADEADWDVVRDAEKQVREKAGGGAAAAKRVLAALVLGYVEDRLSSANHFGSVDRQQLGPYLKWLQSHGHTLTGDERKLVQGQ